MASSVPIIESNRAFPNLPILMEWVQAFVIIIGGIVAVVTLVLYYKEYRKSREEFKKATERQRAEKAIELAKQFAKEINPQISEVLTLTKDDGFRKRVWEKIYSKSNLIFDTSEAMGYASDEDIQLAKSDAEKHENDNKSDIILSLLNDLEAMSIAFNKNVADEKTVYQSLHELFIMVMELLYLDISLSNNGIREGPDKLYTGCIKLYCTWKARQRENAITWIKKRSAIKKEHDEASRHGATETEPLDE